MLNYGIKPNVITYNLFIFAYMWLRDERKAMTIVKKMEEEGVCFLHVYECFCVFYACV